MQETRVRSLGWEDPLEKWQPTPVSLPRKYHGQRSLAGCSPWGCKELETTEHLTHLHCSSWWWYQFIFPPTVQESVSTPLPAFVVCRLFKIFYLFIWLCQVLVAAHGIFSCALGHLLVVCRLLDDSHSDWCEMISHCTFVTHFSDNQ